MPSAPDAPHVGCAKWEQLAYAKSGVMAGVQCAHISSPLGKARVNTYEHCHGGMEPKPCDSSQAHIDSLP